ncbi:MAG: sugar MFS transporter [Terracidiphilus sp.]|nr:sugar MFS transporter [Terracidiphilus sp.]MDR3776249.1 sugar MFS transporter [Terracidiphilus sp.]
MATRSTPPAASSSPNYIVPFIIVTALFGIFGFLTNLNSNLMPHLKSLFDLSYGPAMLVSTAWFFAYLIFSVPSAKLIEAVGYKRTMVISLFIMVAGALLFIPAANLISFPLFLAAIFVLATGVCALQTSANPYVSILGPEHSAPARLTLAQAFNSLGAAIAPLVVGRFILTDPSKISSKASIAHTVQGPYIAIAIALLVLGFAVMFMHLPAISSTRSFRPATDGSPLLERNIWSYSHTVLGMLGIFFYVGVEISLASIAISYFRTQGVSNTETAAFLASFYFVGIMVGRFIGSFIMTWIKAEKLLVILGLFGVVLLLISMFTTGQLAIWTLVLCGLANSIMYPNIFALGIAELGPLTSKGSGVITIGNVGGAVVPLLFGWLADKVGIQYAFVLPIICYLYVAYYGLSGFKPSHDA